LELPPINGSFQRHEDTADNADRKYDHVRPWDMNIDPVE
jgi:hypothetical protein